MNIILQRTQRVFAIIAVSFLTLAADKPSDSKASKARVFQVEAVELSVSSVTKIKVRATGTVRTGGWTQPQLIPSSGQANSADNANVITRHFDFVATKPTGIQTQVITPIAAETSVLAPGAGKTLKVVIHAETNEKSDSIQSQHDPR
jgi:hypothetical protein